MKARRRSRQNGGAEYPIPGLFGFLDRYLLNDLFQLTGFGESTPQVIVVEDGADLARGRAICAEEIDLIRDEIRNANIPMPPRPIARRPNGALSVRREMPTSLNVTADERSFDQPAAPPRNAAPWRLTAALFRFWIPSLWRARFALLIEATLDCSRPGPILVIGEPLAAAACLHLLRRASREALSFANDVTQSRQNPGKPPKQSYAALLRKSAGDLSAFGAVILVGDCGDVASALFDCDNTPPVLAGRLVGEAVAVERLAPPAMPSRRPRISIVSVSFNQAAYLESCIRSVIDQNYPDLEYIMVDGGSTDGSVAIIERYRHAFAHVIVESDDGQSDALNKGFRLATGEVMNWLCSDDLLAPGALERVGRAYRVHGADLIVGGCARIRESADDIMYLHHSTLPLGRSVKLDPYDILKFMRSWQSGNYFFQPEVFFSRRIWLGSGAYLKPHLYYAMDYDMWLRMALAGAVARAIAPQIGYSRVHELQKTRDDRVYLHQLGLMMEEYAEMFDRLAEASEAA